MSSRRGFSRCVDLLSRSLEATLPKVPPACWADMVGETGAPLRCWPVGIPRADARLLAIEDFKSRVLGLVAVGRRGGCCEVSGLEVR